MACLHQLSCLERIPSFKLPKIEAMDRVQSLPPHRAERNGDFLRRGIPCHIGY